MLFADIAGQEASKQLLRQMLHTERVPHALMLLGQRGSGGLPLAWAFARYVLCERPGPEEPCGQCGACRKTGSLTHPDLHFSFPTVGSKAISTQFYPQWRERLGAQPYMDINDWLQTLEAENRQGNITKDECQDIVRKLSLKIFEGRYKILVMWLPEYLGKEGNRLLKLIEEPPADTLFFLVAENQELILNTILSRCQLLKLSPLQDADIEAALCQRHGIGPEQARGIAQLAAGDYREALQLLQNPGKDLAEAFLAWMRLGFQGKAADMLDWTETFAKMGREAQKQFFAYGLFFMQEYTRYKVAGLSSLRLRPQEYETAQRMSRVIDYAQIGPIVGLLDEGIRGIERNANPKILMMHASVRLHRILKSPAAQPSP